VFVFFFQAEDGIRDRNVTGVQTCALPILGTGAAQDPADEALSGLVADLVSGSATDAATALASHAISVVVVPPADSAVTGLPQVEIGRASCREGGKGE